ncbi:putative 7-deoxyloganetin glucosyltransferase [Helianthus debilis subsp. tardiflorus]
MTSQQLVEFGWGLAKSNYSFLWIIRPDLVIDEAAVLPPELLAEINGTGRNRSIRNGTGRNGTRRNGTGRNGMKLVPTRNLSRAETRVGPKPVAIQNPSHA